LQSSIIRSNIKGFFQNPDTLIMVNGVSTNDVLNLLQSRMDAGNIRSSIAVEVIKTLQTQQALEGQALVKMIQQSSLDGNGSLIDISA